MFWHSAVCIIDKTSRRMDRGQENWLYLKNGQLLNIASETSDGTLARKSVTPTTRTKPTQKVTNRFLETIVHDSWTLIDLSLNCGAMFQFSLCVLLVTRHVCGRTFVLYTCIVCNCVCICCIKLGLYLLFTKFKRATFFSPFFNCSQGPKLPKKFLDCNSTINNGNVTV